MKTVNKLSKPALLDDVVIRNVYIGQIVHVI